MAAARRKAPCDSVPSHFPSDVLAGPCGCGCGFDIGHTRLPGLKANGRVSLAIPGSGGPKHGSRHVASPDADCGAGVHVLLRDQWALGTLVLFVLARFASALPSTQRSSTWRSQAPSDPLSVGLGLSESCSRSLPQVEAQTLRRGSVLGRWEPRDPVGKPGRLLLLRSRFVPDRGHQSRRRDRRGLPNLRAGAPVLEAAAPTAERPPFVGPCGARP